jgi:hypothetical protein
MKRRTNKDFPLIELGVAIILLIAALAIPGFVTGTNCGERNVGCGRHSHDHELAAEK